MNAERENREFNTFLIRGLQVTKMLFITNVVTVYSSVQTNATFLDNTFCVRLHTLLHSVVQSLKLKLLIHFT